MDEIAFEFRDAALDIFALLHEPERPRKGDLPNDLELKLDEALLIVICSLTSKA